MENKLNDLILTLNTSVLEDNFVEIAYDVTEELEQSVFTDWMIAFSVHRTYDKASELQIPKSRKNKLNYIIDFQLVTFLLECKILKTITLSSSIR